MKKFMIRQTLLMASACLLTLLAVTSPSQADFSFGFGPPPPAFGGVIIVPGGGPRRGPPGPPIFPPNRPPRGFPGQGGIIVVPGGGPLRTPPARGTNASEQDAVDMLSRSISGLGCNRLSDAVRNLSNELLANVKYVTAHDPRIPPPPMLRFPSRPMSREEFTQRWLEHLTNRELMEKLWSRLADLYRSCDRTCFDDGIAIGQLSGTGYCAASVSVDGLSGTGVIAQPSLPMCSISTFVGCQSGYRSAVSQYQGCAAYTTGAYDSVFRSFESQDCHMDH